MTLFSPTWTKLRLRGFTLTELLVVIGVISILAGLIFPSLRRTMESSRSAFCLSNLRQIGVAVAAYVGDNDGVLPSSQVKDGEDPFAEGATGTVVWLQRVWPYACPERVYPGLTGTYPLPSQLKRTIFECKEAGDDVGVSFQRSYGYNHYSGDFKPLTPDRLIAIPRPGGACLVADVRNGSQLHRTTLNPRHDGKANVVYVDGHAAPMTPTTAITADFSYRDPFWGRTGY